MSKKRTSDESNNDGKPNEGSESLFQQDDNNKRGKLDSLMSDTTLQDLPLELLLRILIKAVVAEVKDLRLVKCVWKDKTELVISRLRNVSSQWSNILATNFFRNELQRTLDGTAEATIRLEVLHESPTLPQIFAVTALKDEIFLLCDISPNYDDDFVVNVYNRNNLAEVTDVIPIPGLWPVPMRACNVSNCVYIGPRREDDLACDSISRISRNAENQLCMSPWMSDQRRSICVISVNPDGSVLVLSLLPGDPYPARPIAGVDIYSANGLLLKEIILPSEIDVEGDLNVMQNSNGNLVVSFVNDKDECFRPKLLEVDLSGIVVRQYQSSLNDESVIDFADIYGRIMIAAPYHGIVLFDSEFNLLGNHELKQDKGKDLLIHDMFYDRVRNEILRIHLDRKSRTSANSGLTIFRFTEE